MLERIVVGCACVGLLLGCSGGSKGPEKVTLSGKVSYQGQPVEDGAISFVPTGGAGGPPTAANITKGTYTATDRAAIAVGTYRVEIRAFKKKEGSAKDSAGFERPGAVTKDQILPDSFNVKSTIEPLTIAPGKGTQTKDFDLK